MSEKVNKKTTKTTSKKSSKTKVKVLTPVQFDIIESKFKEIGGDVEARAEVLITEAKFCVKTLAILKEQVEKEGATIQMCQGKYDIQVGHPALKEYNALSKTYQQYMKQINDLLPSADNNNVDDGFEDF